MQGIGLQSGVAGTSVIPAASFRRSAHRCNRGLSSVCASPVAVLLTARRRAPTRGGENAGNLLSCLGNPAYRLPPPLLSWASTPLMGRKKQGTLGCLATLGFEVAPTTAVVLITVLGFVALRTYVYFRIEYIIAGILGRHVPRGGAKVVELNTRGGKNLYYYPADIAQIGEWTVCGFGHKYWRPPSEYETDSSIHFVNSSSTGRTLTDGEPWQPAGRAGVPIQVKTKGPTSLGVPSSSIDAVVSVFCLRDFPDKEVLNVLREAVRVLKPGKPFIFVETIQAKNNFIGALLNLVGAKRAVDILPYLQEVGLEQVDCEEVFSLVDPHLIGIATKKLSAVSEPSKEGKKGFKSSKP